MGAHSARHGRVSERIPYSWLGAGVITVGFGAALAAGSGIAHADDGSGAGPSKASAGSATSAGSVKQSASSRANAQHAATTDAKRVKPVATVSGARRPQVDSATPATAKPMIPV